MDPSYASSDDEAEAMAKAMGFAAFGTQGPSKKRKFHAGTDAVIDGQELVSLDKGGRKGQGSGGNNIPLGKPRVFGVPKASNSDEISLDEDEENQLDEAPRSIDARKSPPIEEQLGQDDDAGPVYIDTSLPPPAEAARVAQEKIDAILAQSLASDVPQAKGKAKAPKNIASRGIGHLMAALHEPLQMPVPVPAASTPLPVTTPAFSQPPRERNQRNELWYVNYYDPAFNENPWAKLEADLGLSSKGTWLERSSQGYRQAA